tara:strand:+ start:3034 stop:3315 length:282 start_codon:yes stop_codon:yes gene_type:complete
MQLVRLSSGEEIIGDITYDGDEAITIKDGFSLIPAGEGKLGFMPFMAYTKAKEGITINQDFVVFIVEPMDDLQNQVRSMRSGIVTPPAQGIIT